MKNYQLHPCLGVAETAAAAAAFLVHMKLVPCYFVAWSRSMMVHILGGAVVCLLNLLRQYYSPEERNSVASAD